jgi:hypothetical protein
LELGNERTVWLSPVARSRRTTLPEQLLGAGSPPAVLLRARGPVLMVSHTVLSGFDHQLAARDRTRKRELGVGTDAVAEQVGDLRENERGDQQMVRDWQAGTPKKLGASVTPGRASQEPSRG